MPGIRYQTSDATASGDTVRTLIDTLTVPKTAARIIGIYTHHALAATLTSGEPVSGIVDFQSSDLNNLLPMTIPFFDADVLTSGALGGKDPKVWPVDIPVAGGEQISGYVTMDVAQTGALKSRFGFQYEMK